MRLGERNSKYSRRASASYTKDRQRIKCSIVVLSLTLPLLFLPQSSPLLKFLLLISFISFLLHIRGKEVRDGWGWCVDATREHFQLGTFRFGGWLSPGFNQPITQYMKLCHSVPVVKRSTTRMPYK